MDLVKRVANQMGIDFDVFTEGVLSRECRVAIALICCRYPEPISLSDLARAAGMGMHNFIRRFRREIGVTPSAFIRHFRITRAMALLANTDHTVQRIAVETGYRDAASFSRAFLKLTGTQPLRYRRAHLAKEAQPISVPMPWVAPTL